MYQSSYHFTSDCCHIYLFLISIDFTVQYKINFGMRYGSVHNISVRIAYAHMPLINALAGVSSMARCLHISLILHLYSYFVYASNKGSGMPAHMHRLARAFAARRCDQYRKSRALAQIIFERYGSF